MPLWSAHILSKSPWYELGTIRDKPCLTGNNDDDINSINNDDNDNNNNNIYNDNTNNDKLNINNIQVCHNHSK